MTEEVSTAHLNEVKVEVTALRGEVQTGFARIEGQVSNMHTSLDATRRELDQTVKFITETISHHDQRLNVLETKRIEDRDKSSGEASTVRVSLEERIEELEQGVQSRIKPLEDFRTQVKVLGGLALLFVGPAITEFYKQVFR